MDALFKLTAENEIRNLVARYAQYADDGNAEGFAGLFTTDGVLEVASTRVVGRTAIRDWLLTTLEHGPLRHLMTNINIEIKSRDQASCSVDMLLLKKVEGEWAVRTSPRYQDFLMRTDEGWGFRQRSIQMR